MCTQSLTDDPMGLKVSEFFLLHRKMYGAHCDIYNGSSNLPSSSVFSVVIPLFNKRENIIKTIDSVLMQTHLPLEVIVVDDGSTDGSADLIEEVYGELLTLIKQKNSGVSHARNTGVRCAAGQYVAFLDADDFWTPHFLQELSVLAKNYPEAGMVATSYQYYESDNCYISPKIRFDIQPPPLGLMKSYFLIASQGDLPFNASSVAIKKSLLQALDGFPEHEGMGEDQCLWSRIALRSTIAYTPRTLSFYNRSAINRACESSPPVEECPFSRRLMIFINETDLSYSRRNEIVDYTAVHLLDLVERNTSAGCLVVAARLLEDKRCFRKPLKRFRVNIQLKLSVLKYWIKSLFISEPV